MSSTPVKKTVPPRRKRCKKPRSHQTQRQGVEPRVLVPGAHDDVAAPDQVFTDLQAALQAQDSKIEVLREEIKVQDAKIELLCKVNEDQDAKIKAQDAKIGAQDDKIQCQGRLIENMLAKDEEVSELIHCELNENDAEEVAVTEGVKENELLCFVYPRGWFTHE